MPDPTLAYQIKHKDYTAQGTASRLGVAAGETARPLTTDPDREVRLLALVCLDIVGGDDAIAAGLDRLTDADEQVASSAVMLLLHHPPEHHEWELLARFRSSKDPFVRSQLPRVAGRLSHPTLMNDWSGMLPAETNEDVQRGLRVGLARMGGGPSRDWFLQGLTAADGPPVRSWLADAEYIDQPWVLPGLSRLLDKTKRAEELMPDDGRNRFLRTCDLAAASIMKITKAKVSFPFPRMSQLTAEELAQVKRLAAATSH
jgi:hypothetical protein